VRIGCFFSFRYRLLASALFYFGRSSRFLAEARASWIDAMISAWWLLLLVPFALVGAIVVGIAVRALWD